MRSTLPHAALARGRELFPLGPSADHNPVPALIDAPRRWLVTGVAGFIGSHLLEALLGLECEVVGLDDLSTGSIENLEEVRCRVSSGQWRKFRFVEGDVRSTAVCREAVDGVDIVSHQAAINSVPRSMAMPSTVAAVNVWGFVNMLEAAARAGVRRFVFASSSAVYGDAPPRRREAVVGDPLSPYAASKQAGERFAASYRLSGGLQTVGLRYFNVFGGRQSMAGPYSAVIPRWIGRLLVGAAPELYGDGSRSRDFTHVDNVVRANLLAACGHSPPDVVNVGTGRATCLRKLFEATCREVARIGVDPEAILAIEPRRCPPRPGDAGSSFADLETAARTLSYRPLVGLEEGLRRTVAWFADAPGRTSPSSRVNSRADLVERLSRPRLSPLRAGDAT